MTKRTAIGTLVLGLLPFVASPNAGRAQAAKSDNHCPVLTAWTVSPLQTSAPGGIISVAVTAEDADGGDVLTFSWTSQHGRYAASHARMTNYVCEAPGAQTLTINVTDGASPPCSVERSFLVTCVKEHAGAEQWSAADVSA